MSRGTTLVELITMVRAEAGQSTSVAAGQDNQASIIQKIQRTQQMLYDDYDWSFMRNDWDIALQAGQRYYDMPTEAAFPGATVVNFDRITFTTIDYSGKPTPIERGIDWIQYAQYNSDNGEQASPARRWDVKRSTDATEQLEIWPIPDDNTQIFTIRGIKHLRPLVAMSDVADLDDILITLTVAAEILARAGAKDAMKVEAAAAKRKAQLQGLSQGNSLQVNMAGPRDPHLSNRGKTIIRIGSQTNVD